MPPILFLTSLYLQSCQPSLCEAEIVAARRDGLENLRAEDVIALVLGKIKLCP